MLNFNSLLIFSESPKVLVDFYQKVFEKKPDWNEGDFSGFLVGNGYITIGPHNKIHGKSKYPERIMFNFETDNVEKEFMRLKNLKTKVIQKPYHPMEDEKGTIATFEDPDGNYFQIMTPFK